MLVVLNVGIPSNLVLSLILHMLLEHLIYSLCVDYYLLLVWLCPTLPAPPHKKKN